MTVAYIVMVNFITGSRTVVMLAFQQKRIRHRHIIRTGLLGFFEFIF